MIYLIGLGIVIAFYIVVMIVMGIYTGWRSLVAVSITPRDHRRIGKYEESEGYDTLRKENYGVTAEWSSHAVADAIKESEKKK